MQEKYYFLYAPHYHDFSYFFISVINGEKAAFNTPTFAKKRERTLDMLIKDLYCEHMNDSNRVVSRTRYTFRWSTKSALYWKIDFFLFFFSFSL